MTRLASDIAACYEAMREQSARNAKFDILGFIRKRIDQEIKKNKTEKNYEQFNVLR